MSNLEPITDAILIAGFILVTILFAMELAL